MKVDQAIQESLKAEGVKFTFGLYGAFGITKDDPDIKPIEVRYEGTAPFMAMAYARLSGKAGVCVGGTGGTGLTNMASGILESYAACLPMIVSQVQVYVSQEDEGMGAFAECDNVGFMKPITKWSVRITRPERTPWFMHRAFSTAFNGRPGPVFLELPGDVVQADVEMPKYKPITILKSRGDPNKIREAVDLIIKAERPIVFAGGGTISSGAFNSFREFVELLNVPFVTSPQGRGIVPEDHPLSLGVGGIYSSKVADKFYEESDLLIVVGSRMEAFQSANFRYFPKGAKYIQIDVEPMSIGLNWVPDVPIVGDAHLVLKDLIYNLKEKMKNIANKEAPRIKELLKSKKEYEEMIESEVMKTGIPISPRRLAREMSKVFGRDTILCNENGHNDIWTYVFPYYKVLNAGSVVSMGEETCFGSGVVGVLGAKLARPNMNAVCPTGDGAFQHYHKELATAAQYGLGVTWVVFNNYGLGIPGQFKVQPDFVKLAEASKCYGVKVERPSEIREALENALKANKAKVPAVVDVVIDHEPTWGMWGAWGAGFPRTRPKPRVL
jgi:acetolactate synthase-1/2/3 large subunit